MSETIQSQGGRARAANLSAELRRDIARDAANARWKAKREGTRELVIPLSGGRVARIPFPMTQADFFLLHDSLTLWKSTITVPDVAVMPPSPADPSPFLNPPNQSK